MGSKVYIGLGSNLGDRYENLIKAKEMISKLNGTRILKNSQIYETDPVGYLEQDSFLNMVILIETELSPVELLDNIKKIEELLKRKRTIHWGPRTIDIDILLYDELTLDLPDLKIPHPEMLKRAFVLIPLKDIEPNMVINGNNLDKIIDKCNDKEGVRLYNI